MILFHSRSTIRKVYVSVYVPERAEAIIRLTHNKLLTFPVLSRISFCAGLLINFYNIMNKWLHSTHYHINYTAAMQ